MNTTKRNYESLYIVDATLTDEQVDSIVEKYSNVITGQGGELRAAGKWDRRRLAYDVKGHGEGIYILTYFFGEALVAKELDRMFRMADDVFRHIIIRVEPEHIDTSRLDRAAQVATEAPAAAPVEEAAPAPASEPVGEPAAAVETEAEAPAEETPVAEAPAEQEAATEPAVEEAATEEPKAETEAESA